MATATASRELPFDPARKGQYPVRLSERLLAETSLEDFNLASISFNPPLPTSKLTRRTLRPLPATSHFELTVSSESTGSPQSSTSQYTDTQQHSNEATEPCVLIFSPSTQSFILDRLDSTLVFQQKGSTHNGISGLSPLHDGEEADGSDDGLFGEDDRDEDSEDADASNPYDYRHFIKSASQSTSGSQASSRQQSPSLKPSPHIKPSTTFKPSPLNAAHKHSHPPSKFKANPKVRVAAARALSPEASAVLAPSPFGNRSSDSADDDDVLTIEDDDRPKQKNHFRNVLSNLQGDGPISMRSAASSVSPGKLEHGRDDEEGEEEEEEDGDEVLEFDPADVDEESDEDVEEREQFRLPSPVAGKVAEEEEEEESDVDEEEPSKAPVRVQERLEEDQEEEEDAAFEAAIARVFGEQQEGGVGLGVDLGTGVGQVGAPVGMQYESSSESEAD